VNITVHIARRLNTRIAATAMMDGVEWEARCYNKRRHRWETEKVRASLDRQGITGVQSTGPQQEVVRVW